MSPRSLVLLALSALTPSCGSTLITETCIPGEQTACACAGGVMGFQVCQDDGEAYGSCICGSGGSGGSAAAGGEGGTPAGGAGGTPMGGAAGAGGSPMGCVSAADCAALTDACNTGVCINGSCVQQTANEGGPCDDGVACTIGDACTAGACGSATLAFCPSNDPCFVGFCDPVSDACELLPGNDGAACDDGDPCIDGATCSGGTCAGGAPKDCSFLDQPCADGICVAPLGCVTTPKANGVACDDFLFCTVNDVCAAGTCVGAPKACPGAGACLVGSCDEAGDECVLLPGNDGAACDDLNQCTSSSTCQAGACTNGVPVANGTPCDDGLACTVGETCNAGVCSNGMGVGVYFSETFADNSKGWTLGPEWQIGPAVASPPSACSSADPAMDHTPTADNGLAGVVIGGNANPVIHPTYWIESPPFDTSSAPGQIFLQFYRWLGSDYDPYMHNYVQVWDGASWSQLAIYDGPGCTVDMSWKPFSYDVTAYKNAGMRVRFGFDIGSGGVYTINSWSLDDVVVASAVCP